MPTFLSSPQKRAATLTIKALAFFILILCSFIFAPRAQADCITGTGCYNDGWTLNGGEIQVAGQYTSDGSGGYYFNFDSTTANAIHSWYVSNSITSYSFYGHQYSGTGMPVSGMVAALTSAHWGWISAAEYSWLKGGGHTDVLMGVGTGNITHYFDVYLGTTPVIPSPTPPDYSTHIIDFTPKNNATSTNPVTFSLSAYVNGADIAGAYEIQFILHNIDQNVFLLSGLSPSDIYLVDGVFATTSGEYDFSTTTTVGEGNYTLEASITQYLGWGWASIANPLSSVNVVQYHQFIVCGVSDSGCHGTVIGNLQNNGYAILAGITGESTGSSTATSTLASCNPISNNISTAFLNPNFDTVRCALGLLTPDPKQLALSLTSLRDDTLKHIPFGYFTRLVSIFSATTTQSLPTFTITLPIGASTTMDIITLDPTEALAGGAALMASGTDPISHKNLRDVAEPIVLLSLALSVLFTIVADLIGSHKHVNHDSKSTNNGKDT